MRRQCQGRHRGVNLEGGPDRALRLVAVRDGCTEHRHHGVADMLVDRPPAAFDDVVDGFEVTPEHPMDVLGIERLRQPGEAAEVREEHRNRTALAFAVLHGSDVGRSRPAAERRSNSRK